MEPILFVLRNLGAVIRPGATADALTQTETRFAVRLPERFRQLYLTSNGFDLPALRMRVLSLGEIEAYGDAFADRFKYVPFTDCNDSNPYSICCAEPLAGFIAHVFHDDESRLVCRSLRRFFQLLADAIRTGDDADRLTGDLDPASPDRSLGDAEIGRELIRYTENLDPNDCARGEALRFATQMFGPGGESELQGVLAAGDEYVREAVLRRRRHLNTPEARAILDADAAEYKRFVTELNRSVAAAGFEPSNLRLNLPNLHGGRNRPGFLAELLELIRGWQK